MLLMTTNRSAEIDEGFVRPSQNFTYVRHLEQRHRTRRTSEPTPRKDQEGVQIRSTLRGFSLEYGLNSLLRKQATYTYTYTKNQSCFVH